MFEEMTTIKLSGETYPIKCDMAVLEKLQEEFGSIEKVEEGLLTWEYKLDEEGNRIKVKTKEGEMEKYKAEFKWPRMKVVNTALFHMTNEAACIERKEKPFRCTEEAARKIDITPVQIADLLHAEFSRCFQRKNG